MKVMFIPWIQATHYYFMVPLAWAFRAAGDEVRVASPRQRGEDELGNRNARRAATVGPLAGPVAARQENHEH